LFAALSVKTNGGGGASASGELMMLSATALMRRSWMGENPDYRRTSRRPGGTDIGRCGRTVQMTRPPESGLATATVPFSAC
jgi:hypothetical protein